MYNTKKTGTWNFFLVPVRMISKIPFVKKPDDYLTTLTVPLNPAFLRLALKTLSCFLDILVTLMVIFFVSTPLKAVLLTTTAFFELITIVFTDLAPVKAFAPIFSIVAGRVTFVAFVAFLKVPSQILVTL